MGKRAKQQEAIRRFALEQAPTLPRGLAKAISLKFEVSRQTSNKHLASLVAEGLLQAKGKTSARTYTLAPLDEWTMTIELDKATTEDDVWRDQIEEHLADLPSNARDIWYYGFTEMFNNVIDHAESKTATVSVTRNALQVVMIIADAGIGIFKKIKDACGLEDERHAVLELAKGKLTTDPERHTGEGIFFSSRIFDEYWIFSGDTVFSHSDISGEDWILTARRPMPGTRVKMTLGVETKKTTREVFDEFTEGDDYGFTKTVVPVRMALYGDDQLVSRSQAKRLLSRIDRFATVLFDFQGVDDIGQAFADEIFRVFANKHEGMTLTPIHANTHVMQMINRARSHR